MSATGVGAPVARKEDERFLRGRGQYVGDFRLAGVRDVAFVRSPLAHARIRDIHIPTKHKGVVFTAQDLAGVNPIRAATTLRGFKHSSEPILATGKVRYVGEIVAMCLGGSRAEAEDIAAQVTVDYDELPAVGDMLAARRADTALVHEDWGDNVFIEFVTDGAVERAVADAAIKVTREIRTARHCMVPIEGRAVVAYWDARLAFLTVISASQFPHVVQRGIAECLGLPDGTVRVISPDVGGGFGYKGLLSREEVALAWLARHSGEGVRWLEDCREHLTANANCREHHYHLTGYADRDGRLLALDCEASVDAGAYSVYPTSSALEAAQIASLLPGPYDFSTYRCRSAAVATNKCPILPYRGVARTGVCLAIEVVMDAIAREAGLEPCEVRLRNLVRPEQMPFENVVKKEFDGGDYPECLRRAVEAIDLKAVRARQREQRDGRLAGVGFAIFCEQGAMGTSVLAGWGRPVVPGYEPAAVRLTADGHLEIRVGTHSHGQGHETTLAQIAHEVLGIEFERIKVLQGDTLLSPFSTGTWGSRSIVMAGGAVAQAARALAERAKRIGAWLLQTDAAQVSLANGSVASARGSVTLQEIARAWYLQPQYLPPDVDPGGLEVTAGYRAGRDSGTFSYATHAARVEIDVETGLVEIVDYVVVEDGGTLINPMIVDGQIRGGTAQGIGTCLYEAMPFSPQGQPLASTMLDYLLPRACDVPNIRVLHMQTPSPHTEFGMKGIGEGGAVGPPAAIVCAVNDALHGLGVEVHDLPFDSGADFGGNRGSGHQTKQPLTDPASSFVTKQVQEFQMPFDGLRPYLETLEKKGLFKWVDREVDRDWEIATVTRMMFRAMPEERRVGVGFRNIRGFPGGRVVAGVVAASVDMIATGLECEPNAKAINERVERGIKKPLPTVMVKDARCKEVIRHAGELDLTKIPTPVWTPGKDAGPYFTPLWVTRDPDTGRRNLGIRRCQVKGPRKTGILFGAPDRGGAIHHAKWKMRGQPMPAAFYVGADPVHYLVAPSRYGEDELAVAGGIRGAPVEMVKCETVDLEVPASAEFVVEGEVAMEEVEPQGPFGEFTGYMAGGRACPVFNVKCITHRQDPIVMGVVSQFPPSESSMIKKVLLEAGLVRHLTETLNIPGIADAHVLEAGGGTAVLWVSLRKIYTGQVDQVMFGALGHFGMSYFKWIVVTDDDVDIRDPFMRDWILSWRVQPDRDLRIIPNSGAVELDPSVHPPNVIPPERLGAKVLIDATKKFDYPAISLPPTQFMQRVYANWSDYGLPALGELRLPKGL